MPETIRLGEKWPLRVLLVEDERVNRMIIAGLLSRYVTAIREATDGAEALELIEAEFPDLLITDWSMPRLDGLGLLAELEARGQRPSTIVLTAHQETDLWPPGRQPTWVRVMHKPLRLHQLAEALGEIASTLGMVRL